MIMNKNCIVTLNYNYNTDPCYNYLRKTCIPSIERYANRIKVDFVCMDKKDNYYNTWNQMQALEYLDIYDNIMYIDGDIYIHNNYCINIFDYINDDYYSCHLHYSATENNTNNYAIKNNVCVNLLLYFILNKKYKDIFKIPHMKLQSIDEYPCLFDKVKCKGASAKYRLFREECYFNQIVFKNKLKFMNLSNIFRFDIDYIHLNLNKSRYKKNNIIMKFIMNNHEFKNKKIEIKRYIDSIKEVKEYNDMENK